MQQWKKINFQKSNVKIILIDVDIKEFKRLSKHQINFQEFKQGTNDRYCC